MSNEQKPAEKPKADKPVIDKNLVAALNDKKQEAKDTKQIVKK